jgi:hypothetical protein
VLRKYIDDIFKGIISVNMSDTRDSIPHSDEFIRQQEALLGLTADVIQQIIVILRESHKILSFEIQKEDKQRNIRRIEGYVDADITTVRRLRSFFHGLLIDMYEKDYSKSLLAHQIIQELFPKINLISNTPLGILANKAIMLDEYERLLEKRYNEYTEEWKQNRLREILEQREEMILEQIRGKAAPAPEKEEAPKKEAEEKRRAVDSEEFDSYNQVKSKMPVEKLLSIYGVDFFFRVHLRRCEFDFIMQVLDSGVMDRAEHLKKLKDMIQKVKNNSGNDPAMADHLMELFRLDRAVSQRIRGLGR